MKWLVDIACAVGVIFFVSLGFGLGRATMPPEIEVVEHHHYQEPAKPEKSMGVMIRNNGPEVGVAAEVLERLEIGAGDRSARNSRSLA